MLQFVLVRMQLKLGILFGFFVWWGGCFLGGSFSVLCCLCYLVFLVVFFFVIKEAEITFCTISCSAFNFF